MGDEEPAIVAGHSAIVNILEGHVYDRNGGPAIATDGSLRIFGGQIDHEISVGGSVLLSGGGASLNRLRIFPSGIVTVRGSNLQLDESRLTGRLADGSEINVEVTNIDGSIKLVTDPLVPGDFDGNLLLDSNDIRLLTMLVRAVGSQNQLFDVNEDDSIGFNDLSHWVHELKGTWFGDSNLDGEFNSADLVDVFQTGEYEDHVPMNSSWATGDWNGDAEFDTSDLVLAFQDGGFEQGPREAVQPVPEPNAYLLVPIGFLLSCGFSGRRRR